MMKESLLRLAEKYPAAAKAKHHYQSIRNSYYARQKINEKLIVFEAFRSTKYVDSPKAIYEYLLNAPQYKDYTFIWVFEHPEKYGYLKNERTKLVRHESHAHYMAFARAKYWVINGWIPLRFAKKPGQVVLQCWHGTPLKRLRHDIISSVDTEHKANALRDNDLDAERFDYFISPSRFATKAFTSAFNLKKLGKQDIVIETGYPRNDYLINYKKSDVARIKEQLDVPKNKKLLLYAPTWRDDQNAQGGGYNYKLPIDFDYLKEKLGDEYVVLFRAHSLVANSFDFGAHKGFIYDVSTVDDINDLYIISDVLMTDYSSVFFDYANLKRPMIFYMYDLEHYANDLRGFYFDINELPGAIVKAEKEIVAILQDTPSYQKKYAKKYQAFSRKFNYLDDGKATKRVVDILLPHKERKR